MTADAAFSQRLLSLAAYAGGAPLLWALRRRLPRLVEHHARQALGVFMLLAVVTLLFLAAVAIISYTMVHAREVYEEVKVEAHLLGFVRKAFLCWIVFWAFGAVLALFGSWREMPLVGWVAERDRLMRFSASVWSAVLALLFFAVALAAHGELLLRDDRGPARAYFLYEDVNKFPRGLFMLGFYPLARASRACFGPNEAVALELTRSNILLALKQGEFVFIGSHGTKRGLMVDGGYLPPEDLPADAAGSRLEYVYMTGCDQKEPWVRMLAPARVVTFDRLSTVIEHIWWLWMEGPDLLCQVAASKPSMGPSSPAAP